MLFAIVFYFRMNILWMVNCRDRYVIFNSNVVANTQTHTHESIFHIVWSRTAKSTDMRQDGMKYERVEKEYIPMGWSIWACAPLNLILDKTKHIYYSTTILYFYAVYTPPSPTYLNNIISWRFPLLFLAFFIFQFSQCGSLVDSIYRTWAEAGCECEVHTICLR